MSGEIGGDVISRDKYQLTYGAGCWVLLFLEINSLYDVGIAQEKVLSTNLVYLIW